DGKNAFFDSDADYHLSDAAKSYIAGLLRHAREIAALFAPNVNSYKRLVPGYEAPVYCAWSQRNRSALVRVPVYHPGKEQATRSAGAALAAGPVGGCRRRRLPLRVEARGRLRLASLGLPSGLGLRGLRLLLKLALNAGLQRLQSLLRLGPGLGFALLAHAGLLF